MSSSNLEISPILMMKNINNNVYIAAYEYIWINWNRALFSRSSNFERIHLHISQPEVEIASFCHANFRIKNQHPHSHCLPLLPLCNKVHEQFSWCILHIMPKVFSYQTIPVWFVTNEYSTANINVFRWFAAVTWLYETWKWHQIHSLAHHFPPVITKGIL